MRKLFITLASIGLTGALAWSAAQSVPLVLLMREGVEGMVWETNAVQMGDQSYPGSIQGLGSPGTAVITYDLKGEWDVFEAYIGYKKNSSARRNAKFSVLADQQTLFTSDVMKGDSPPEFIRVNVQKRRLLQLRIEPNSYDSSLGACFGGPVLKRGVPPEEMTAPYRIDVNGKRIPYERFSAPAVLPVEIPIKAGESTFQVQVKHDTEKRQIQVITTP